MATFSERSKLETAAATNTSWNVTYSGGYDAAHVKVKYDAYLAERPALPVTYEQFLQVVDFYARDIA